MAVNVEPAALGSKFASRSGLEDFSFLFSAPLMRRDYQGRPSGVLAEEAPSIDRETWKLLPNGGMETTYRLRPSAAWHDGTPLTADDFVFTWKAILNPDLPAIERTPERSIERMEAVDARTLQVHWKEIYTLADEYTLEPLPRHILEPLIERDPQSFANSLYWSREWVGAGPYKIVDWVPGSHLTGAAFSQYALGAPKIQQIHVSFVPDANQALARVLAGTIDLTVGSVIRVEEGATLKEQFEARGEGSVIIRPEGGIRLIDFQFREPLNPAARDVRVRRALYHALDRQLVIDALQYGLPRVAHMMLAPGDLTFEPAEATVSKYPHDVSRAAALLAEAGWTRGGDGSLRNASGERFDLVVRVIEGSLNNKEGQVTSDFWKSIGVNPETEILPRALQNDNERRATFPGVSFQSTSRDILARYSGSSIPTAANSWRGNNRGGYANPELDRLSSELFRTIDLPARINQHAEILRLISDDLPSLPLYYQVDTYAVRSGLQGVVPSAPGDGWSVANAHRLYWEK
jgi:peptide/nickel transport system substrate-binding protein